MKIIPIVLALSGTLEYHFEHLI